MDLMKEQYPETKVVKGGPKKTKNTTKLALGVPSTPPLPLPQIGNPPPSCPPSLPESTLESEWRVWRDTKSEEGHNIKEISRVTQNQIGCDTINITHKIELRKPKLKIPQPPIKKPRIEEDNPVQLSQYKLQCLLVL